MNAQVKDGNKKVRTLEINGFVKPSGTTVASVKNDRNEVYFVQISAKGKATCKHIVDGKREECKGHQFTGHCYHVDAVKAAMFSTYEQITAFPLAEVMADADTAMRVDEQQALTVNDKTYAEVVGYVTDPRKAAASAEWQAYRNYEMSIGAL